MEALVTGASGFIGQTLIPRLVANHEVTVLLRPGEDAPSWTHGCAIARGDLAEPKSLPPRMDGDVVLHLAAISDPAVCEKIPKRAVNVNVAGTAELLARTSGRFILASTVQVYARSSKPLRETSPPGAGNVYAATKLLAERVAQKACDAQHRGLTILRLSNVYGAGQTPDMVVGRILDAVARKADIRLRSLHPERDFLYVDDAVDAWLTAIQQAPQGVFNIAAGQSHSIRAVAEAARDASHHDPDIQAENKGPQERDAVLIDAGHAAQAMGWRARHTLDQGIAAAVERLHDAAGR